MEDKTFELITKMYSEFSKKFNSMENRFDAIENKFGTLVNRFDSMEKRFDTMEKRFDTLEAKIDTKADKSDIIRLETELREKTTALFDGYKQNADRIARIEEKIDIVSSKLEKQDVEIRVIKSAK